MGFSLKNILSQPSAKGQVIDGHLILSLPNATEPVVWRMELDKIGTASFEVKQDNETGHAKLVLKPKKGTAEVIAPFSNKEEAVEALLVASNALQNVKPASVTYAATAPAKSNTAQKPEKTVTQYHDVLQQPTRNQNSDTSKWLLAVFGAIIVIGLYYYLTTLIPENITGLETQSASGTVAVDPTKSTGVPVSADEFLGSF
jgi:hypothetical protein